MEKKSIIIKDILKDLEFFRYKYSLVNILSDCFEMFAICISNTCDFHNYRKRENLYLDIIKKYNKEEIDVICKIFGRILFLCQIEDNDFYDYLGELYMLTETNSKQKGQYFTPYGVSQLLSKLAVGKIDTTKKIITLNEPTCGSGGTIIASIEELAKMGIPISDRVLVVAQDIDARCVYMTYLQFSIMGIPAIILKGDTLSQKFTDAWRTPEYFRHFDMFEKELLKVGE